MNKRGDYWLGEETGKVLISVLVIILLAFLLVSVYFHFRSSKELDQAKSTLSLLMNQASGGMQSDNLYNPKDWWLTSFSSQLPKTCSSQGLKSCICICDGHIPTECDRNGFCADNHGFSVPNAIQISNPPVIVKIDQINKKMSL